MSGHRPDEDLPAVWTSHDALVPDYEAPQVRLDPENRSSLLTSAHLPWIGSRVSSIPDSRRVLRSRAGRWSSRSSGGLLGVIVVLVVVMPPEAGRGRWPRTGPRAPSRPLTGTVARPARRGAYVLLRLTTVRAVLETGEDSEALSAASSVCEFASVEEMVPHPLANRRTVDLSTLAEAAGLALEDVVGPVQELAARRAPLVRARGLSGGGAYGSPRSRPRGRQPRPWCRD
ncbi:3-deoxy-7-phosphoheptulonate synthase [Streptomyces puniciscabiei]